MKNEFQSSRVCEFAAFGRIKNDVHAADCTGPAKNIISPRTKRTVGLSYILYGKSKKGKRTLSYPRLLFTTLSFVRRVHTNSFQSVFGRPCVCSVWRASAPNATSGKRFFVVVMISWFLPAIKIVYTRMHNRRSDVMISATAFRIVSGRCVGTSNEKGHYNTAATWWNYDFYWHDTCYIFAVVCFSSFIYFISTKKK